MYYKLQSASRRSATKWWQAISPRAVSYITSTLIVGTSGFCLMVQTKYYLYFGMMWFITQKQACFLGNASISCTSGAPSLGSRLIPNMHTMFSGALLPNTLETLMHPPNSLPLTRIACVAYIGHVVLTQGLCLGRWDDGRQALIQIVLGCFNYISIYIANWHSITASQNSTTTQCRLY